MPLHTAEEILSRNLALVRARERGEIGGTFEDTRRFQRPRSSGPPKNPLQMAGTLFTPLGVAGDISMFSQHPETRTPFNIGMAAASVIPGGRLVKKLLPGRIKQSAKKTISPVLQEDIFGNTNVIDKAETIKKLPPVPEGKKRLFRGESDVENFLDVFEENAFDPPPKGFTGQHFTDDIEFADYFRATYRGGKLRYIDVPEETAKKAEIRPGEFLFDVEN